MSELLAPPALTASQPRLYWPGWDDPRIVLSDEHGTLRRAPRPALPVHRMMERERYGAGRDLVLHGENYFALEALLAAGYEGQVDLAYLDPPFNTGRRFEHYDDRFDLPSYLSMLHQRLVLLHRLLSAKGTLVLHLDEHFAHLGRLLLDDVCGAGNYRNSLIVKRVTKNLTRQFQVVQALPQAHDVMLVYSREPSRRYPLPLLPQRPGKQRTVGYWKDFWSTADRPTMRYDLLGVTPSKGQWKWRRERAEQAVSNYRTFEASGADELTGWWRQQGEAPEFIRRQENGKVVHWVPPNPTRCADTLWDDLSGYSFAHAFPTEKSEALLGRVIDFFSAPDDLVLDCFAGSGTTAAAAASRGRRWVLIERGAQTWTHIVPRLAKVATAGFRVAVLAAEI